MARIFVSHTLVDGWLGADRAQLDGELMRFAGRDVALLVVPAVYFERVDGNDADPHDIIGSVKSTQELAQLGAEHYETSVVLGDAAYTVRPGFMCSLARPDGVAVEPDGATWGNFLGLMQELAPGLV